MYCLIGSRIRAFDWYQRKFCKSSIVQPRIAWLRWKFTRCYIVGARRPHSAVDCLISHKFGMWMRYVSAEDAQEMKSTAMHEIQAGLAPRIFNRLLDSAQVWYIVWPHVTRNVLQTLTVKRSKVNVIAWKRRLIANVLLSVRKSWLLNLMAMSGCWTETGK